MDSGTFIAALGIIGIVVLGVFFPNHHVDSRIGDLSKNVDQRFGDMAKNIDSRFSDMAKLITAESARLEAVLKLEIAGLTTRVKVLEDRESPIVRTRG